jgi:hypothetical protein
MIDGSNKSASDLQLLLVKIRCGDPEHWIEEKIPCQEIKRIDVLIKRKKIERKGIASRMKLVLFKKRMGTFVFCVRYFEGIY